MKTYLVRADEADEDTCGSEEEPRVDPANQLLPRIHSSETYATVMIIQMAKPRFRVIYLGASVEMSLPAA